MENTNIGLEKPATSKSSLQQDIGELKVFCKAVKNAEYERSTSNESFIPLEPSTDSCESRIENKKKTQWKKKYVY